MMRTPHAHRRSWLDDDRLNAVLWLIAIAVILVAITAVDPGQLAAAR